MITPPALRVAGLMKSYGDLDVLRGVDFDVAPGSIFALLGSNGVGKTTVIKILSTLLRPDGGTAEVNGFDVVTQAAGARQSISLTGQFAAVDEILTGRENLALIAMIEKDVEQWTEDQVADFDLDDELAALLDEVFINAVPVARTLLRLLEERGWTGWTKLRRIDPAS